MDNAASKGSIPTIPVELLLSYPYFWRPAKISKFAVAAAKVTEKVSPSNNRRSAQAVNSSWKDVLSKLKCDVNWPANVILYDEKGTEQTYSLEITHFDILTRRYNVHSGRRDARKVPLSEKDFGNPMELLKIIRNKHQHSKDMPPEFLKELNWATADGDFDESKFGSYWATHFPCLMPFLWVQFFPARTKKGSVGAVSSLLKEFYPDDSENRKIQLRTQDFPIDMEGIMLCLDKALQCDLEGGGLTGRVKAEPTETVLEFRTLESGAIQRILDSKLIFKIKFSSANNAHCLWYSQSLKPTDESKIEFTSSQQRKNWVVIIGNVISDVHKITATELKSARLCKVLVLSRKCIAHDFLAEAEKVEKEIDRLFEEYNFGIPKHKPVQWKELCQSIRESIIRNGKFRLQNEIVSLDSLLPDSMEDKAEILSGLEGNLLNQLLREMTPQFWHAFNKAANPEIYMDRRVEKISAIGKKIIKTAPSSELFVLFNISIEEVEKIFSQQRTRVVDEIDSVLQYAPTIFVMKQGKPCNFEQICSLTIKYKCLNSTNIHLVRCMHGSVFEWVSTHGSTNFLEESCANFSNDSKMIEEDDFMGKVRACWDKGQTVAITDIPGNGKSKFLLSQARKSSQNFSNHLTVFLTMSELVKKVVCSENENMMSLADILCKLIGSTEFERKLCAHWLRSNEGQIKFEIFLDALDEIKVDDRPKAELILKALQKLSSVRICVALRDHILEDFQQYFANSVIFKLEPFSSQLQADYLVTHWQSKAKNELDCSTRKQFKKFAVKCLSAHVPESSLEIAGTPLICSILAEIYEPKVLSGDYTISFKFGSTCNLFDLMWERKLEIWLAKQGISVAEKEKHNSVVSPIRAEMQNWHTYLAIKLLFTEEVANKFKFSFFMSKQSWESLPSTVSEQGIITSLNPITFLHQTFAEDIVARFVVAVFEEEFFGMPVENPDFENFLSNCVLASHGSVEDVKFKCPTLCHFINLRSQNQIKKISGDIWFSLVNSIIFFYMDEGNSYARCFLAAYRMGFEHLIVLLLSSPKYLFALFVLALQHQGNVFCKYVLEDRNYVNLIFDPENWTKFCSLDWQGGYSKELWFFQVISSSSPGLFYKVLSQPSTYVQDILACVMERAKFIFERKDADGKTPLLAVLSMPVSSAHAVLAKYLVTNLEASVHDVDNFGNTVFHASHKCTTCHSKCSERFPSEEDVEHYVLLWKFFLENGLDKSTINNENRNGETPLVSAINVLKEKAIGTLQFFKENGAKFNGKDKKGETVLDKAIRLKAGKLVDALIECGADINGITISYDGVSSLIAMNCTTVLEKCIEKFGANFHTLNSGAEPIAHKIIRNCDNKLIKKMFDARVNNACKIKVSNISWNPITLIKWVYKLILGCPGCRFKLIIKNFQQNGVLGSRRFCMPAVNLNVVDEDGVSALHCAAMKNAELMEMCVKEYGLDVNFKDAQGKMFLHKSIEMGEEEIVRKMVELGADITLLDDSGESAAHLAAIKRPALLEIFIKNREDAHSVGPCGNSAFHHFTQSEAYYSAECYDFIRKYQPPIYINAVSSKGKCALHSTVAANRVKAFTPLVDLGAKLNLKGADRRTIIDSRVRSSDDDDDTHFSTKPLD